MLLTITEDGFNALNFKTLELVVNVWIGINQVNVNSISSIFSLDGRKPFHCQQLIRFLFSKNRGENDRGIKEVKMLMISQEKETLTFLIESKIKSFASNRPNWKNDQTWNYKKKKNRVVIIFISLHEINSSIWSSYIYILFIILINITKKNNIIYIYLLYYFYLIKSVGNFKILINLII